MNSKMNKPRRYSELEKLNKFEERYEYLKLSGVVGEDTFGFDRYLNQKFYKSKEWKDVRNKVIARDNACDLGVEGRDLYGTIYVHHMNPIRVSDISKNTDVLLNPEYLICVSSDTHNAIHYGDLELLNRNQIITRESNDTCPWKKGGPVDGRH